MASEMESGRNLESELASYYDQEAADRATRALDPRRVSERTAFIERCPPGPATELLEVGAGPGLDAAAFRDAGFKVSGVDLSAEHARYCQALGVDVALASVLHLPFRPGSFNAVWTMSTLVHVPNREIDVALHELCRVTRPGGVVSIGVWGGPDVERYNEADRYDPPRFFSRRSDRAWRSILDAHGAVDQFDTWGHERLEGWWYQFARLRPARVGQP